MQEFVFYITFLLRFGYNRIREVGDRGMKKDNNEKRISGKSLLLTYLAVWLILVIAFWCFTGEQDGIGYSLLVLWIIIPLTTFIISFIIGRENSWGNGKWFISIGFGIMYMLAEYATFSMANNLAFDKVNAPEYRMILIGTAVSLAGMVIGYLIRTVHIPAHMLKSGKE